MVVRSTPESFIHACMVDEVSESGRPEENPESTTINMRRLVKSRSTLIFFGASATSGLGELHDLDQRRALGQ